MSNTWKGLFYLGGYVWWRYSSFSFSLGVRKNFWFFSFSFFMLLWLWIGSLPDAELIHLVNNFCTPTFHVFLMFSTSNSDLWVWAENGPCLDKALFSSACTPSTKFFFYYDTQRKKSLYVEVLLVEHIWTKQLANCTTGPFSTMNTNSLLIYQKLGHEKTYQVLGKLKGGEFHGSIYMLFVAQRKTNCTAWQSA